MKKVALVFLVAVFVPSLVLAWLAIRSLRDQQLVLERQQSLLYQGVTDSFAKDINDYLAQQQREFNTQVESLVAGTDAGAAAASFDERLRKTWPLAEVGFCVTLSGNLLCPSPTNSPVARVFCVDNSAFLGNRESAEVYLNEGTKGGNPKFAGKAIQPTEPNQVPLNPAEQSNTLSLANNLGKIQSRKVNPAQQASPTVGFDNKQAQEQNYSKVVSAEAEFRQLIGEATDGMLARFLQNKLKLMFWHRLEKDPQLVFGAQLNLTQIRNMLQAIMNASGKPPPYEISAGGAPGSTTVQDALPANRPELGDTTSILSEEISVIILDDNAKPVARSNPHMVFQADWKRPFVATEIGEALPHWEVAAYLRNPDKLKETARTIQLTLGLLILVLVVAIGVGGWLIANELNRQLTLARQKTDFVSNVSHELKTPLTSIRMFSELLAEGRVNDPAKQRSYLHIITAETARLTRLINNVLDFSRLERGEKKYNFRDCDLVSVARDTAETYRPHLENNGFKFDCSIPEHPLPVRGDTDALAQIIVNLLSNAEKYSNGPKEIELLVSRQDGPLPYAEVKVLDRGPGVPRGSEEKIFEKFYRAHDSLSSGIQGSGLGLTLARQIARAHGGDVVYESREGGGSCFALRLPLIPQTT